MRHALLATLFLAACETTPPVTREPVTSLPAPPVTVEPIPVPVPPAPKPLESLWPKQEWTDHTLKLVRASRLASANPSDAKSWCNRGMSPEGWTHLLAAMAKFESGYRPTLEYKENFKDSKGRYIISTGLLQLSLESSKGYSCGFTKQSDLYDPLRNIECGVKILEKWVTNDGCISCKSGSSWRGGARFWSVLRYKKAEITSLMLPFCL